MPPDKGCRQTRAEIVRRRSWGGVLPLGRHVSISGSSFIQCASASIAPPHPGGPKCYPGAEVQGRTGSNLVHGRLLEWALTPPLWHAEAVGGRPHHQAPKKKRPG